jgi:16S rRNA G966 N2-methylase RsmD
MKEQQHEHDLPRAMLRRVGYLTADALARVLRLTGEENYRFLARQLTAGVYRDGFEVEGIDFHPNPCGVGLTPQGRLSGASASDLIIERGLLNLRVLDICCGAGIVGLTMLARLTSQDRISHMSFADSNIFNVGSVKKTIAANPLAAIGNFTAELHLSDNLSGIAPSSQFDLIVSHPPYSTPSRSQRVRSTRSDSETRTPAGPSIVTSTNRRTSTCPPPVRFGSSRTEMPPPRVCFSRSSSRTPTWSTYQAPPTHATRSSSG